MSHEYHSKKPTDKEDIQIIFKDTDPEKNYTVESVVSATAIDRITGDDVSDDVFDTDLQRMETNKLTVWLNPYGQHNDVFDLTIVALMSGGQQLTQTIELSIDKYA